MKLILASASPQRRDLLAAAGYRFEVLEAEVEEDEVGRPDSIAEANALAKARQVSASLGDPTAVVLGADTVVALEGRAFGKPADEAEAASMLGRLAGQVHLVHTGVAVVHAGRSVSEVATSEVTFRPLDPAEIAGHVASGEWRGRAGGYAIQGAAGAFVESLEGDLDTVIGLPLQLVARLLPGDVQPTSAL